MNEGKMFTGQELKWCRILYDAKKDCTRRLAPPLTLVGSPWIFVLLLVDFLLDPASAFFAKRPGRSGSTRTVVEADGEACCSPSSSSSSDVVAVDGGSEACNPKR